MLNFLITNKISPHPIFIKSSADFHTTFLSAPDRNTKNYRSAHFSKGRKTALTAIVKSCNRYVHHGVFPLPFELILSIIRKMPLLVKRFVKIYAIYM